MAGSPECDRCWLVCWAIYPVRGAWGFVIAAYGVYRMLLPLFRNKEDKEDS